MAKLKDVCVCVFVCATRWGFFLSRYAKLGSIVIRFVCCFAKEQKVSADLCC